MSARARLFPPFLAALLVFSSCHTAYQPTSAAYKGYRVTNAVPADSTLVRLTKPYRDSVDKSMNEVVGQVERNLEKGGTGTLGNFMTDALLFMGRQKLHPQADVAFVNTGGIRITQLPAGPVTRGKIFELMPFDNILVMQELDGRTLQQFLDFTASRGGWPAAGLTMEIRDKKAVNVWINGQPIDPARTYRVLNSDYVVNGGDDANMLRGIPQRNTGYLLRDALFDYIKAHHNKVIASEENRITHAQ